MKLEYKIIILSYLIMQLFMDLFVRLTARFLRYFSLKEEDIQYITYNIVPFLCFLIVFLITLFLLKKEFSRSKRDAASFGASILWGIGGFILVLFAQILALNIEQFFNIEPGSENTQGIMELIYLAPTMIVVTCIMGPALEEVIFRKILFGSLYKRFGFWIAALISSVIFALAHMEIEHTILYSAIGITFSFLYVKTKRIIVPILSHCLMNSFVVYVQYNMYQEKLNAMLQNIFTLLH